MSQVTVRSCTGGDLISGNRCPCDMRPAGKSKEKGKQEVKSAVSIFRSTLRRSMKLFALVIRSELELGCAGNGM